MTNRRSLLGGAAIGGGVLVIGGIAAREFLGGGRSSYISSGSVNPLQIPTLYPVSYTHLTLPTIYSV